MQRVLEKADRPLPLCFAVGLEGVLGVVQDDDVAALTCQRAADGRGKHHPLPVVLEFVLTVDVVLECETVAPGPLIPRRQNDVAGKDVVLAAQIVGIADLDKPLFGVLDPRPNGIAYRDMDAFHVPRGHIDDQAVDLPQVHGLHVLTNEVNVPVVDVLGAGLYDGPRLPDEIGEVALRLFAPDFGQRMGRVNLPERRRFFQVTAQIGRAPHWTGRTNRGGPPA